MSDRMIVALDCWKGQLPGWVGTLVRECDASSQGKVARRLNITPSTVSQVIRNSYKGSLENVKARVEAVFQDTHIKCPALGEISGEGCMQWRDQSETLSSANPLVVSMFRECRKCPRNQKKEEDEN